MSIASKLNDVFGNSENKESTVSETNKKAQNTSVSKSTDTNDASVLVSKANTNTFVRRGRENEELLPWENRLHVSGIIVYMYKNKDNVTFVTLMVKSGKNKNGDDNVFYPQFRFFSETKNVESFRVKDFVTIEGYARSFYMKSGSGFTQSYIGLGITMTEPTITSDGRSVRRFENTATIAGEVMSVFRTEKVESYTIKTVKDGKASFFTIISFRHNERVVLHSFVKIEARLQTQRKTVEGKPVTTDSIVASSIRVLETKTK